MEVQQNTLYLTTPGSYVARDHLTLQVEVPLFPTDLPAQDRTRDKADDWRKLSIPIHHLESICVFGASTISPPALDLCWEHGVSVNFHSEFGYLQARMTGVADTSVTLRRAQFRAADDPAKVECEPIVSAKIWDQVNLITEEQLKKWKKPGKVALHIFGNLTWCHCGGKMYARSDSPKYHCRKCNHKIPTADLEAIFREELHAFFGTREKIAAHMNEAKRNIAGKETELAALERQIQKVRDDMKQTHQLYLDGHVTPQGFGQFYKPAEERLNQLCVELPKLEAEVAYLKVNDVSGEEVLSEAKTLYERWPKLASENKRKIAEAIIEKIIIGDGAIDLTFSYMPTSEELCKSQQRLAPATG